MSPRSCAVKFGDKAKAFLDLAGSEPVNINVFPNLSLLGNHIQVFQPISFAETDTIWYGTKIEDVDRTMGEDVLNDINTLRMRTQEGFPNFGEVDDVTNFEQIQRGSSMPGRRMDLYEPRPRHPRSHQGARGRHVKGAGHRRDLHAGIHEGMETSDEDAAEPEHSSGALDEHDALNEIRRAIPTTSMIWFTGN